MYEILSPPLQYIVLVIIVFIAQTVGGVLAFVYRNEVSTAKFD